MTLVHWLCQEFVFDDGAIASPLGPRWVVLLVMFGPFAFAAFAALRCSR